MAFELKDFERSFTVRGDDRAIFQPVREDIPDSGAEYYAFMNESGSYVIQRTTTSGTVRIHQYYAKGKHPDQFETDWSGRAALTFVEIYQLFPS